MKGEVVDIGTLVFKTTLNLISNTIYSVDLVHSAEKAGEFKELVSSIFREGGRPNVADCFPVLKVVDPLGIRRRVGRYIERLLKIFKGLVEERVKEREESGYCTKSDLLDALLDNAEQNGADMYEDKIERLSWVCSVSFHSPFMFEK